MTAQTSFKSANQLLREGKLDAAVAAYREAITVNPGFSHAHHNLGEALVKAGRVDEAVAAFRRAVELNPQAVWSLFKLGELLRGRERFEEAVGFLRRAVELKSDVAEFNLGLGAALVRLGSAGEEAEACLRRAVELNPFLAEAFYFLGVAASRRGQWSEAVEFYGRGLDVNPSGVECGLGLAEALGKLGRWSEAVERYGQMELASGESGEVCFGLGQALGQLGRWEEGVVEYRRAVALGFAGAEVRHHLGYALGQLGRWEEGVVEYRLVVEVNPKSAPVRHQLGYGLMRLGRWGEAAVELRKSVELYPGSAVVWQQLGDVLRELGEDEEAVGVYRRALELRAGFAEIVKKGNISSAKITVLLLNYKRSQNIPKIVKSLRSQTVPVKIFLWDNSSDMNSKFSDIDLVFKASQNQGCSPRWFMALYAKTKYIMTHDDDFLITRNNAVENIIECLENQQNLRSIVGLEGIIVNSNKSYRKHIGPKNRYGFEGRKYGSVTPAIVYKSGKNIDLISSERVHLVKGRLMATRTENIVRHIDLGTLMLEREDDITVSAMIGNRKKIHLIPSFFKDCIEELEAEDAQTGNKDQPTHYQSRDFALRRYFQNLPDYYPEKVIKSEPFSKKAEHIKTQNQVLSKSSSPKLFLVVPFNDTKFLEQCLKSIEAQTYRNFKCVVVDDFSDKNYSSETRRIINSDNFELVVNQHREYALKSRILAIEKCIEKKWISDEDVIVHIDGDDWLAHENSLSTIVEAYSDGYTWVAYGGAKRLEKGKLSEPFMHALSNKSIEEKWGRKVGPKYPEQVISARSYRNYPWGACHCRTFKYKLYKNISEEDFKDASGNYFRYATDMAIFIPVLEMAGERIKYIEETIYIYNRDTGEKNVANEFKHQHNNHNYIRGKLKYNLYLEADKNKLAFSAVL